MRISKKKRNLFEEIKQGLLDAEAHLSGKITLRTHKIIKKPKSKITPKLILDTAKN